MSVLKFWDGTAWKAVRAGGDGARRVQVSRYATVGSATWTVPAGLRYVHVEVVGAGGGGGSSGAASSGQSSIGGGGGSGGLTEAWINADELLALGFGPGSTIPIEVGAGGTATAGASGGQGGTSSFGTMLTAGGGFGGIFGASATTLGIIAGGIGGDRGGSGVNDIGRWGSPGMPGIRFGATVGAAGTGGSLWGGGGRAATASSGAGTNGAGRGGGGGGAISVNGAGANTGGTGASGYVHITAFLDDDAGAGGAQTDTGWVDMPVEPGFAAQSTNERPQCRRIGNQVFTRGGVSNAGIAVSGSFNPITIPEGFRPPLTVFSRAGTSNGPSSASVLWQSGGAVQIRTNATLSAYYFFHANWLVD